MLVTSKWLTIDENLGWNNNRKPFDWVFSFSRV
jgi:hypothetical protein